MRTEIDNDKLAGTVTETTSSDSYIEDAVTTIKGEVYGLNGQIADAGQGEVYNPHKMGSDPVSLNTGDALVTSVPIQDIKKITHRHSALGISILRRRQNQKAA